mgnify:CR=1 FL=1
MRINTKNMALSGGIVYAGLIFIMTVMSSLMGTSTTCLGFFMDLPFYSLTVFGGIIGFFYGFIFAYILLYVFATLYNFFEDN